MTDPTSRPRLDLTRPLHAFVAVIIGRILYGVAVVAGTLALSKEDLPGPTLGALSDNASALELLWYALIEPWVRRDTGYFLEIATTGYDRTVGTTAFHPAYPYLSKLLGFGVAPSIGLFLVSTLAATAFVVLLARYVDDVHGKDGSNVALAALLAPAGFCWFLLYTEGLFTAAMVGALWAAHRSRWGLAMLAAALAVLTRQQGLALMFCFGWYVYDAYRSEKRIEVGAAAATFVPGLTFFGWSLFRVTSVDGGAQLPADATMFDWGRALLVSDNAQSIAPGQRFAPPWEPLIDQVSLWLADPGAVHLLLDMVLGWGLIAALAVAWKHLTAPERIWSAAAVLLTLCYYNGEFAPYMALPRHVIIAFPLYLGIVRWLDGKNARLYVAVGVALNLMLALLFASQRWIP